MRGPTAILVAIACCVAVSVPLRASACECVPSIFYQTSPRTGAKDVPLDFAPLLEGAFVASSFSFEDEHGAKVEFTLHESPGSGCVPAWAELVPLQPLAAKTRYTIHVDALYPDSLGSDDKTGELSFTTGDYRLGERSLAAPPLGAASALRGAPNMCTAAAAMLCLGGLERPEPHGLELTILKGDKILLRTSTLIQEDGLYALSDVPDCVELRRRDDNGQRSEPAKICGDALPIRDWQERDSIDQVVQCHAGVIGRPEMLDAGMSEAPAEFAPDAGAPAAHAEPKASGCALVAPARGSELHHMGGFLIALLTISRTLRRRGRS